MDIKNTAELGKIADLCRKKGIDSIKITADSVEFKLLDKPVKVRKSKNTEIKDSNELKLSGFNSEEALFWSSSGLPETVEG